MFTNKNVPTQLSPVTVAEFKAQYLEEFPTDKIADAELHARALRVLRVLDIIVQPSADEIEPSIKVTDQEFRILAFLHRSLCHEGRSPPVREVAEAAGPKSSRSGMRLVERFIAKNWMARNKEGRLELAEWLKDCNTTFLYPNS